jgi:hypothetical protein
MMIDSTHLKARRTAASLLKKGIRPAVSVARKAGLTSSSMQYAMPPVDRSSFFSPKAK